MLRNKALASAEEEDQGGRILAGLGFFYVPFRFSFLCVLE